MITIKQYPEPNVYANFYKDGRKVARMYMTRHPSLLYEVFLVNDNDRAIDSKRVNNNEEALQYVTENTK